MPVSAIQIYSMCFVRLKKNPTIRSGCGVCDFLCLDTRYPPCLLRRSSTSGRSSRAKNLSVTACLRVTFIDTDHVVTLWRCQYSKYQLLVLPHRQILRCRAVSSNGQKLCLSWAGDLSCICYSCPQGAQGPDKNITDINGGEAGVEKLREAK